MALFYKELKELRDSRGISLEEIHERTKINIKYLNGIENGNFEILPVPYVRLFLRAYTEEIGGNSHKEGVEKIFSKVGLQTTFLKDLQGDFRAVEVRK